MELETSNPYAYTGRIIDFGDGEQMLVREKLQWTPQNGDRLYTVREGDKIDLIAFDEYKGYVDKPERYWWVIADVNDIENPLDLTAWEGRRILIPNILAVKLKLK